MKRSRQLSIIAKLSVQCCILSQMPNSAGVGIWSSMNKPVSANKLNYHDFFCKSHVLMIFMFPDISRFLPFLKCIYITSLCNHYMKMLSSFTT